MQKRCYGRPLGIERECVGEEHPATGGRYKPSERVVRHGRIEEAETSLREAIAVVERTLGRGHRDVAMRPGNLATLLHRKGQNSEAQALVREVITSGEATLVATTRRSSSE